MNYIILGSGFYGRFYTSLIARGVKKGKIKCEEIFIVSQETQFLSSLKQEFPFIKPIKSNYDDFILNYIESDFNANDQLIPDPFAPHMLFGMVLKALKKFGYDYEVLNSSSPVEKLDVPVKINLESGISAVSFAQWICPSGCIEPRKCPAIKSERTWEMEDEVVKLREHFDVFLVFKSKHYEFGLSTIPVIDVRQSYDVLKSLNEDEISVFVATISSCHGIIGTVKAKKQIEVKDERIDHRSQP